MQRHSNQFAPVPLAQTLIQQGIGDPQRQSCSINILLLNRYFRQGFDRFPLIIQESRFCQSEASTYDLMFMLRNHQGSLLVVYFLLCSIPSKLNKSRLAF